MSSLDRLRALSARILDRRTMERVIDPLLADLHMEYEEANQRGCVWKRRWTLPHRTSRLFENRRPIRNGAGHDAALRLCC